MPAIHRPVESLEGDIGVDEAEFARLADLATVAAQEPAARPRLREFYRAAPMLYSVAAMAKVMHTRRVDDGLESVERCRETRRQALELGFDEEAAALAITGARLAVRMYSTLQLLRETAHPLPTWREALLEGYAGLAAAERLPADDAPWWADRFAEVAAALFPLVAAYDWPAALGGRAQFAHLGVARRTAIWAKPDRAGELKPMRIGDAFPGTGARLQATLAHLESWMGRMSGAGPRLERLLATPIDEPSDRAYAWMIAVATARRAGRAEQHARWRSEMLGWMDAERLPFASFEARLYAQQVVANGFEYALRVWADCNLHDADDVWTVAEALKARVLLDEMSGCRTPPLPGAPDPDREPAREEPAAGTSRRFGGVGLAGLDSDTLAELVRTSYWTIGETGGSEAGAPAERGELASARQLQLGTLRERDAARAAHDGGYAGIAPHVPTDALRAALHDDELLVEVLMPRDPFAPNKEGWVVFADRERAAMHGFYVDPGPVIQLVAGEGRMIERGPLSDRAARARAAILSGDDAAADEELRFLFDLLVAPVIAKGFAPERYARWIVVPHGPLHLLPWAALLDSEGRRLVERVAVVTAPSASVWHRLSAPPATAARRWLGVGDPGPREDLDPLPEAEAEVAEAAAIWRRAGMTAECLTGATATEAAVTAALQRADIVHVAAHGLLDLRRPRDGHAIALAGDAVTGSDGRLQARELRALDLSGVRLAVLNLCHGVFCRYGPGDEPLGLLSAFLAAGAANVLGAIWELPDEEARRFAVWFCEALAAGEAAGDPAAALRAASRRAIDAGWPVAHWAGMVLVGGGRRFAVG